MDKPTENDIALNYDRGWRAYDIHYTTQKLFQNVTTGCTYWLLSDEDHTNWHALRDYQDEQRKKGVPIGRIDGWKDRSYFLDGFTYTFISQDHRPVVYSDYKGYITVARFTNFRWRAGYPKDEAEESRKHCHGFVSDRTAREEKGGHNG